MSQQRYQDLLRQVNSSRVKYVYAALQDIKKNLINTTRGVERLVGGGLVQRLLQITSSRDSLEDRYRPNVIELCISILGNMCMEESARKQVIKLGGIEPLADLFDATERESLQNRTCRCLANLLLTPGSWELAHKTSVCETITKRLSNTDLKEDTKKTFLRAIRLLGQTGAHVWKLLEVNAVGSVMKHIDSGTQEVNQSALRCLHSLSVHGCSVQFATQVVSSGKIAHLIDLILEHNEEAFQVVVRLNNNHNFRPEFGNAGGILNFHKLFMSTDVAMDNWKTDLLNVLCLCCKEAVNRVKLREEKVLDVFLESLSDEHYSPLHERIVSALVCFLYDESSIEILLGHGMVEVLVRLLNIYVHGGDDVKASDTSDNPQDEIQDCNTEKRKTSMSAAVDDDHSEKSSAGRENINTFCIQVQNNLTGVKNDTVGKCPRRVNLGQQKQDDIAIHRDRVASAAYVAEYSDRRETLRQPAHEHMGEQVNVAAAEDHDDADDAGVATTCTMKTIATTAVNKTNRQSSGRIRKEAGVTIFPTGAVVAKGKTPQAALGSVLSVKDIDIHSENDSQTPTSNHNISDDALLDADKILAVEKQANETATDACNSSDSLLDLNSSIMSPENHAADKTAHNSEADEENDVEMKESMPPVYSIDSPTYGSSSDLTLDSYWEGAKCIESFSPSHPGTVARQSSYSPFSNASYYSPVKSPPEYSQGSSPVNWSQTPPQNPDAILNAYPGPCHSSYHEIPLSPTQLSSQNARHLYTGINCRIYNTAWSPAASPERSLSTTSGTSPRKSWSASSDGSPLIHSDDELKIVSSVDSLVASSEQEELVRKKYKYSPVSSPLAEENMEDDTQILEADVKSEEDRKHNKDIPNTCPEKDSSTEQSSADIHVAVESYLEKKRKKVSGKSTVFENNILILLSRVSQMTNPTMHLVTKEVLTCLLDYITVMEAPLARCARLLSRIFRNPACFLKLISLQVPTLIYCMLLQGEDIMAVKKKVQTVKASPISNGRREVSSDSDRYSMTDEDEGNPFKRRRLSSGSEAKVTQKFKGVYHTQEEEVCVAGKCGIAFLEDLSCVADSQYGQGTMDRLFHTCTTPGNQHIDICITLIFIVWSAGSRHFYFHQRDILDLVLTQLQDTSHQHTHLFNITVRALSFLAKMVDTKRKYQSSRNMTKQQINRRDHSRDQSKAVKGSRDLSKAMDCSRDQCKTIDYPRDQSKIIECPKDQSKTIANPKDQSKTIEYPKNQSQRDSRTYSSTTDEEHLSAEILLPNPDENPKSGASNANTVVISPSICDWQSDLPMDIMLVTREGKIPANRSTLIKQSEVFSAMLTGHYSEARLSQIRVPETSSKAFSYIQHFMHGCNRKHCSVLNYLYSSDVTLEMVNLCIEVILEADKYFLVALKELVVECLFHRLVVPEACLPILKYSTICNVEKVRRAAVSSLLVDCKDTGQLLILTKEVLKTEYANVFLNTLVDMLVGV